MIALDLALGLLAAAFLLALLRIARGPTLPDRVVAGEVGLVVLVGGLALLGVRTGGDHVLDVVVVAALVQFVATIAVARLLEHKEGP